MRLIAKIKLIANADQIGVLRETLELGNECCNWLSLQAWEAQTFGQFALHKIVYHDARKQFPALNSSAIIRCIAKVADAYKLNKKSLRRFSKHGALAFDHNTLRFIGIDRVSIWSLGGRLKLNIAAGNRQKELLHSQQGESDLIFHRGGFYLAAPCEVVEPAIEDVDDFLGIDLGITKIVVDSDGGSFSGSTIKGVRYRHSRLRTKLQKKQTRSAKRKLKKLAGKESRFAKDLNHCISKKIVAEAKRTHRGIAIEELKGIRGRIKARRKQRAVLHSWSFAQLRKFIEYKAQMAGVTIVAVDPRNTSRECSQCGHVAKANRPSQSVFCCVSCGYETNADFNAALNIRGRALVNVPNVTGCVFSAHDSVTSRLL